MTEPLRDDGPDGAADPGARTREARIEELLLAGLDHYFNAQHELAINVWTRVLFLDRGHARARAYIERARGAIAERQREGDELVHTAVDAFRRGDAAAARTLLLSAVERGVGSEEAIALLQRLDRLDVTRGDHARWPQPPPLLADREGQRAGDDLPPARRRESRLAWVAAGLVGGFLVAALGGATLWRDGPWWMAADRHEPRATAPPAADPLPVPAPTAASLRRARSLAERGHLHEALVALEVIRPEDSLRAEADALKASIQRQLLAAARGAASAGPGDRR